jgi:hypothetical protein
MLITKFIHIDGELPGRIQIICGEWNPLLTTNLKKGGVYNRKIKGIARIKMGLEGKIYLEI